MASVAQSKDLYLGVPGPWPGTGPGPGPGPSPWHWLLDRVLFLALYSGLLGDQLSQPLIGHGEAPSHREARIRHLWQENRDLSKSGWSELEREACHVINVCLVYSMMYGNTPGLNQTLRCHGHLKKRSKSKPATGDRSPFSQSPSLYRAAVVQYMDDFVGFFNLVGKTGLPGVNSCYCGGCHWECTQRAVTLAVLRRNLVNNAHVRHHRI